MSGSRAAGSKTPLSFLDNQQQHVKLTCIWFKTLTSSLICTKLLGKPRQRKSHLKIEGQFMYVMWVLHSCILYVHIYIHVCYVHSMLCALYLMCKCLCSLLALSRHSAHTHLGHGHGAHRSEEGNSCMLCASACAHCSLSQGTLPTRTWDMIMGQRALAHLAHSVVADSEKRVHEYAPQVRFAQLLLAPGCAKHQVSFLLRCCKRIVMKMCASERK